MSKLIERLCEMTKVTPQPLGFRTARAAIGKARLLLVTCLPEPEAIDKLADVTSGADAVLLTRISPGAKSVHKIGGALKDVPWGVSLTDITKKDLKAIIEAGCDFVTFSTSSQVLAVPRDEDDEGKIGRVLQLEPTFDVNLLRLINELPIDAVYIADEPRADFLTWYHEMLLQRFSLVVAKPLLICTPDTLGADELELLWEVGMDGVVVECSPRLAGLRRTIDGLSLPARKRRHPEALVPMVREAPEPEIEEEEEEE